MTCKSIFPLLSLIFMLFVFDYSFARLNFSNRNSTFKASGTSTFNINQAISSYTGTLTRASGANINGGHAITFDDGILESSTTDALGGMSEIMMTGNYTPAAGAEDDSFALTGNTRIRAESGQIVMNVSTVSGTGNWIEGQPIFGDNPCITLGNGTLNMAIQNKLNNDIDLGGDSGILKLYDDLRMADGVNIRGAGTIDVNHKTFELGRATRNYNSAITWQNAGDVVLTSSLTLEAAWTFDSDGTLDGDGHILDLEDGGKIKVTNDSTLLLKNVTIRNVSGAASSGNIEISSGATLRFQDVTWAQTGNYTFDQGTFTVMKGAEFKIVVDGSDADDAVNFIYTSDADSTIDTNATMYLNYRVTFSYDVPADATRLAFTDRSSTLYMHGATLHCGSADYNENGFQLQTGTLVADHNCTLNSTGTTQDKCFILGNGSDDANNFHIEILPGALLDLAGGYLKYNNTDA